MKTTMHDRKEVAKMLLEIFIKNCERIGIKVGLHKGRQKPTNLHAGQFEFTDALKALLLVGCVSAQAATNDSLRIGWDYPASEITNRSFAVFTSPTITVPVSNWTYVATVNATNYMWMFETNVTYEVRVPVDYGPQFWTVAVIDPFWGTNFFDVWTGTNARPRTDRSLTIQR